MLIALFKLWIFPLLFCQIFCEIMRWSHFVGRTHCKEATTRTGTRLPLRVLTTICSQRTAAAFSRGEGPALRRPGAPGSRWQRCHFTLEYEKHAPRRDAVTQHAVWRHRSIVAGELFRPWNSEAKLRGRPLFVQESASGFAAVSQSGQRGSRGTARPFCSSGFPTAAGPTESVVTVAT